MHWRDGLGHWFLVTYNSVAIVDFVKVYLVTQQRDEGSRWVADGIHIPKFCRCEVPNPSDRIYHYNEGNNMHTT